MIVETNKKASILVVDDSIGLLTTMQALLEYHDFEVSTSCAGKKALELLQHNNFDLVICDIQMPAMNGLELLNRIKSTIKADLPVILMTGHISADYAVEAIRLGADDFIGKPIDASMIIRSIRQQLSRQEGKKIFAKAGNFMDRFETSYVFTAEDFLYPNLASTVITPLQQLDIMSPSIFNSVSICIDEMINNAFIHGTYDLSEDIRSLEHEDFKRYIQKLLISNDIRNKKVYLKLAYNPQERHIEIEIKDEGKGFIYESVEETSTSMLDFSGTGRGLYLIKILSDRVHFSDNGTKLKVIKKL